MTIFFCPSCGERVGTTRIGAWEYVVPCRACSTPYPEAADRSGLAVAPVEPPAASCSHRERATDSLDERGTWPAVRRPSRLVVLLWYAAILILLPALGLALTIWLAGVLG